MNRPLLIEWTHDNEYGIPILDEQHRGIVSIINSFEFSILHQNTEFTINTTFNMMDSYTKLHFSTEETILRDAEYPGIKEHMNLHKSLIMESYSMANRSLRMYDPNIYLLFLKRWWMSHIMECDRVFVGHVKKHFMIE